MSHFGILSGQSPGHLNPILSLGRELSNRGHRVTAFGLLDAKASVLSSGVNFSPVGETEYPLGAVAQALKPLGEKSGIDALSYTINLSLQGINFNLEKLPEIIKAANIEVLIVDQSVIEGGTLAEYLHIPFVSVCCALILNQDPGVPPIFKEWQYSTNPLSFLRNRIAHSFYGFLTIPIIISINEFRKKWNLPLITSGEKIWSSLAQISQQPAEFEFPRERLPSCFHFTGPLIADTSRETVAFPFEKLTGRTLVYASMGTVQNRLLWIFGNIAQACVGLDIQLVISLGGGTSPQSLPSLPGSPLIVEYAPQLELLKMTNLTITHAGLNTVLESLSNGVPMIAIPIANDQPGVAARIAWTGTGEVVPLDQLSVSKLRSAIQRVLTEDSYKKNALRLQEAIRQAGGVNRAADIVEQVVSTALVT